MEAAELLDIAKYLDHWKVYSRIPISRTIGFLTRLLIIRTKRNFPSPVEPADAFIEVM